jgi:rSAM/selenodomain-associated transferase 1
MNRTECVLLVRLPVSGRVKRRLAADIGSAPANELYRRFVADMLETFEKASVRPVICHHPPGAAGDVRRWLGPRYRLLGQRGRDHPERLRRAFEDLFAAGADRVLIFASDLPDLPAKTIRQAARALDRSEAVLGPGADGGYYVIGFRRESFVPGAFRGIAWSTERAFGQTAEKIRRAGRSLRTLPRRHDIDNAGDLDAFIRRNRGTGFSRSFTMEYLRRHPGLARIRPGAVDGA